MLNGSYLQWHSKTEQPDHSKSDQIAILDFYVLVLFLDGRDHSCSYLLYAIWPKTKDSKPSSGLPVQLMLTHE